jgi:capsular polysaccharide biosynthesis protein
MELIALWKMFLRRWWLIVLPPVVTLILVAPQLIHPTGGGFITTIHLTAAQPPSGDEPTYEDGSYTPWTASEYVVNSLAAWVTTDSFLSDVSSGLAAEGIDISVSDMRKQIVADNARSVMAIYLTWPDEAQLEAMARVAVSVLQDYNQRYFPQLAAEPAQVIALDGVVLKPVPPSLLERFRPAIAVMLALIAGIALASLLEFLDDAIYGRDDVDEIELAVLAEIPRHKGMKY